MNELLLAESKEVVEKAIADIKPYAIVLMLSGGDDSVTAGAVARALGVRVDFVMHGRTRTGIYQTTEYCREVASLFGEQYIEADAGDTYERTVLARGFFGIGTQAHAHCYHRLKSEHFVKAISRHIRHHKHNRRILLLNGARFQESNRRKSLLDQGVIRQDAKSPSNYWVSLVSHWKKSECLDFLQSEGVRRNPVCALLHRSAECLCGSTQRKSEREEAAFWYPEWGDWLTDLERRVREAGYDYGWGEAAPKRRFVGQPPNPPGIMCQSCEVNNVETNL